MPAPARRPPQLLQLLRQPALFVWALYVLAIPFYVVAGGYPQPGDALLFVVAPMVLFGWRGRLGRQASLTIRWLRWLTVWVCIVDLVWAVLLWNAGLNVLYPLYFVYNLVLLVTAVTLFQRYGDRFLYLTVQLLFFLVVFQVAVSFVFRGGGWGTRSNLFFHNPNQLGYFALLTACVFALTQRRLKLSLFKVSVALLGCAYLGVLSASRSSVAGIGLLALLMVVSNPRVLIAATLIAAGVGFIGTPADGSFDTIQQRLSEDRNPGLSFWQQRGYDRIWNNKEYLLFGAGEGNYRRFEETTAIGGAEIHSSAGTLIFSYGIIGSTMFVMFCAAMIRGAKIRTTLVLLPPLSFTIAHQGLRFTLLWILFALFIGLKEAAVKKPLAKPARAPQGPALPQPLLSP